jgi:hypothetical protein
VTGIALRHASGVRLYDGWLAYARAPLPALRMAREVLDPVLSPYRMRPLNQADIPLIEALRPCDLNTPMAEVRSQYGCRLAH